MFGFANHDVSIFCCDNDDHDKVSSIMACIDDHPTLDGECPCVPANENRIQGTEISRKESKINMDYASQVGTMVVERSLRTALRFLRGDDDNDMANSNRHEAIPRITHSLDDDDIVFTKHETDPFKVVFWFMVVTMVVVGCHVLCDDSRRFGYERIPPQQ